MTAIEFIFDVADMHIPDILARNEDLCGCNGPHNHAQTLTRNLGHWLITCVFCHHATGEQKYLDAVKACAEYLESADARPTEQTFRHRKQSGKDQCNGLVGQAWSIEALVCAGDSLGESRYHKIAEDVFAMHDFSESFGIWFRREVDGSRLGPDPTFNHQLWFAYSASLLESAVAKHRVQRFLDNLERNLSLYPSGLVWHLLPWNVVRGSQIAERPWWKRQPAQLRMVARKILRGAPAPAAKDTPAYLKCVGYHAFNTYALGLLKKQVPQHHVWSEDKITQTRKYLRSDDYRSELDKDKSYGYAYNAPGFEVPLSLYHLDEMPEDEFIDQAQWWLQTQIDRTFDAQEASFSRNTADPATLTARVYELTRLPRETLKKINTQISP